MRLRGIRGATTVEEDTAEAIRDATAELLLELVRKNGLGPDDLVSLIFTVTPDLTAAFPAATARALGYRHLALLDVAQAPAAGGPPRCIRALMHAYTARPAEAVAHVYLRRAAALREDLAR